MPVPFKDPTPEEQAAINAEAEKQFNARGNNSVKFLKLFFEEVIATLPDEIMPLDQAKLDELMKPRCENLYAKVLESNLTGEEIETAVNQLLNLFVSHTGKRIENRADNALRQVYKYLIGFYSPVKEMPLGQLEKLLNDMNEANEIKTASEITPTPNE